MTDFGAIEPSDRLPLCLGHQGTAVRDLQVRLSRVGTQPIGDPLGHFGAGTEDAVRAFQRRTGLIDDGICDAQTWQAIIEAGFSLGDRLLYRRSPMMRGDDITDLQSRLSALGFHAGRVDGIFGPDTSDAVTSFQRNTGLATDGVVGPEVLAQLARLHTRTGTVTKAHLREQLALQNASRQLEGQRIVIAHSGSLPAITAAIARHLDAVGAHSLVVAHPDGSTQAAEANEFAAQLFLGLSGEAEHGATLAYYKTVGFASVGGQRLAAITEQHLQAIGFPGEISKDGMRLQALRETRMPAMYGSLGPVSWLVEHSGTVTEALAQAVITWIRAPYDPAA